jgi:hypothetical protein
MNVERQNTRQKIFNQTKSSQKYPVNANTQSQKAKKKKQTKYKTSDQELFQASVYSVHRFTTTRVLETVGAYRRSYEPTLFCCPHILGRLHHRPP